jgi:hypothetical protein
MKYILNKIRTLKSFFFSLPLLVLFLCCSSPVFSGPQGDRPGEKEILRFLRSFEAGETGLFRSYSHTAWSIDDPRFSPPVFMRTTSGYLDDDAFTYDQAVAIVCLIYCGESEKAKRLLKIFEDNFDMEKNGRRGLLNSYVASRFDCFFPAPSGEKDLLCLGVDGNRIHLGPNAWMGLASEHYYASAKDPQALRFALKIFTWAKGLHHYPMPDGSRGAVSMGFGWGPDWENIYSTENNLDYYAFLKNLAEIYDNVTTSRAVFSDMKVSLEDVKKERSDVEKWLLQVAWNKRGTFNRGAHPDVDTVEALDCNTWALCSLGPSYLESRGIDPKGILGGMEKKFAVEIDHAGQKFSGFDFTDKDSYDAKRDRKVIWWEGTSQAALCFRIMADHLSERASPGAEEFLKKYSFYINEMRRLKQSLKTESGAMPYITPPVGEKEVIYYFEDWWPAVRSKNGKVSISLVSTVWNFFAEAGFNPFELRFPEDRKK